MSCPCGTSLPLERCCGRYLGPDGDAPPTAEALMRSRYTAYVTGDVDHIVRTQDDAAGEVDRPAIERFSRESEWLGLEIVATERGGEGDEDGMVEFVARYRDQSGEQRHHERSRFERREGRWRFVDGQPVKPPPARRTVTAGRNDPCPCGSGKKYKRCHGG